MAEKSDVDLEKEKSNTKCFKLKQLLNDQRVCLLLILISLGVIISLSVLNITREKGNEENKIVIYQPVDPNLDDDEDSNVDHPLTRYITKYFA